MHDIKAIRETPDAFDRGWTVRGLKSPVMELLYLDSERRASQTALQEAQSRRNDLSKLIGAAKAKKDEAEAARLMGDVEALKGVIAGETERERAAADALSEKLAALPNIPDTDVPPGEDETGNVEQRRWGEPFAIQNPKDHVDLGGALGLMDFEAAARMSGARFVVLKGELARLERALGQFMLDMQTREHGYLEVSPPLLVRNEALFGTGQLPKFGADLFFAHSISPDRFAQFKSDIVSEFRNKMESEWTPEILPAMQAAADADKDAVLQGYINQKMSIAQPDVHDRAIAWLNNEGINRYGLIPTAEVSLTNLVREQIVGEEELPMRLTALTPCFRSEAGASGKDTRGMIRQHQFIKCELVSIATPEQSAAEHERMVECAEAVLKRLDLPHRTMLLCSGDMGFSARKTYDIEVWLPSQGLYREISSISNCGDFQARRMDARCRVAGEKGTRFVHTLNGSGLAVGRTLVALMENYQDEAGRIAIPQALQCYMGGLTHIGG